jgi:hypothetical protein
MTSIATDNHLGDLLYVSLLLPIGDISISSLYDYTTLDISLDILWKFIIFPIHTDNKTTGCCTASQQSI